MRITKISVKGLFGYLDHEIPLNQESRITIVHGQNGVGKTVLVSMLDGLFALDHMLFKMIRFNEFRVDFETGESITVYKRDNSDRPSYCFEDSTGSQQAVFTPRMWSSFLVGARGYWMSKDTWSSEDHKFKRLDDKVFDLIPSLHNLLYGKPPDWLIRIRRQFRTSIVHTQRLEHGRGKSPSVVVVIVLLSWFLAALTQYLVGGKDLFVANLQTSAKVLIPLAILAIALVGLYFLIEWFQQRNDRGALPLTKKLDDHNSGQQELTFMELINSRLQTLSIEMDEQEQLIVRGKDGNIVPQWLLSSGEKQLTHIYSHLLFDVEPDSLVIIDEPEISLHVNWQRRFLEDLQRIVELRQFDVLIATHSPQIVGDKRRWLVKLQHSKGE